MWHKACGMCCGGRILEILSRYPTKNNKGTKLCTHLHLGIFLLFHIKIKCIQILFLTKKTNLFWGIDRQRMLHTCDMAMPCSCSSASYHRPVYWINHIRQYDYQTTQTDGHHARIFSQYQISSLSIIISFTLFLIYNH